MSLKARLEQLERQAASWGTSEDVAAVEALALLTDAELEAIEQVVGQGGECVTEEQHDAVARYAQLRAEAALH